ncbi:hypothetical protein [Vibrio sp. M260118]|uniref:hypothetical protein n=1 Tax=Vibrio sp. M260118 TaxID=3020896 RepID=UPI002F415C2A
MENGKLDKDGSRSLKKEANIVSAVIDLENKLTSVMKRDAPRICDKKWQTTMKTWVSEEAMRKSMGYENRQPSPGNRSARIYEEIEVPFAVEYIELKLKDGLKWN